MGSGSGSAVLRHHQLRHVPFLGEPREAGAAGTRQEQTHRSTHRGLGPAGFLGFSYSSLLPGLRGQPERLGRREEYRSEEHTSELQSLRHLVCRLLLEKKKKKQNNKNNQRKM